MTGQPPRMRGVSRRGVVAGALALLTLPVLPAWAEGIRNRVSMFRRTFPVQPDVADAEVLVNIVLRGREPVARAPRPARHW